MVGQDQRPHISRRILGVYRRGLGGQIRGRQPLLPRTPREEIMKKLITIIAVIFFAGTAFAQTNVTFKWSPNSESDLAGYRIYMSDQSGVYTQNDVIGDISCVPDDEPCCTYVYEVEDGTWFFVATAYDTSFNESDYSNEITDTFITPDTTPPEPPEFFKILQKILAWIKSFRLWG